MILCDIRTNTRNKGEQLKPWLWFKSATPKCSFAAYFGAKRPPILSMGGENSKRIKVIRSIFSNTKHV